MVGVTRHPFIFTEIELYACEINSGLFVVRQNLKSNFVFSCDNTAQLTYTSSSILQEKLAHVELTLWNVMNLFSLSEIYFKNVPRKCTPEQT